MAEPRSIKVTLKADVTEYVESMERALAIVRDIKRGDEGEAVAV